jgi:hypothetical protein
VPLVRLGSDRTAEPSGGLAASDQPLPKTSGAEVLLDSQGATASWLRSPFTGEAAAWDEQHTVADAQVTLAVVVDSAEAGRCALAVQMLDRELRSCAPAWAPRGQAEPVRLAQGKACRHTGVARQVGRASALARGGRSGGPQRGCHRATVGDVAGAECPRGRRAAEVAVDHVGLRRCCLRRRLPDQRTLRPPYCDPTVGIRSAGSAADARRQHPIRAGILAQRVSGPRPAPQLPLSSHRQQPRLSGRVRVAMLRGHGMDRTCSWRPCRDGTAAACRVREQRLDPQRPHRRTRCTRRCTASSGPTCWPATGTTRPGADAVRTGSRRAAVRRCGSSSGRGRRSPAR